MLLRNCTSISTIVNEIEEFKNTHTPCKRFGVMFRVKKQE